MDPYLHGSARAAFAAGIFFCAASGLAHAEVIDGNWCSADGRHFSIQGSTIVTPGGTKTEGSYSPHHFAYIVPPADSAAGTPICIMLVDEVTVHVHPEHVAGATNEVWKRCDVTSRIFSPAPAKLVNKQKDRRDACQAALTSAGATCPASQPMIACLRASPQ